MIEQSGKTFLTVREFAAAAGRSSQAIYKKLDGQLSTYVLIFDNQKFIDSSALSDVFGVSVANNVGNKVGNSKSISKSSDQQNISAELIEMLKEEIRKKDEQIEKLQLRLDHAQDLIADMAQKAQYITAADKTEKILLQQPKEEQKEIIEAATAEKQNTEKKNNTEEKPKKKWFQFWKRT